MQIGDFRFITDNRDLAAALWTLGVPAKNPVPITNEYTPENPKPPFPVGHARWRPGDVKWHFESVTAGWTVAGCPIQPKALTTAFFKGKGADSLQSHMKALDDAFTARDINAAQVAWNALRNDLPFVLMSYLGIAAKNRILIWLPMLKKAWTQTTLPSGNGQCHLSTNPSEAVKSALL
jgi:hypothetical protein